ncbi:chemotaxis protein CheX [Peribacillus sp. SI8-4]|uniref:chemotaxis protein CheX n=1 Tax=Peribacillus sp. SI8-4 TaxID=3048009 RepID=UPI002557991D|nr:chemotaxis protein CheX [Peribacillus sp. SI8-4]
MEINAVITKVLNGTILAVKSVLPFSLDIQKPSLFRQPFEQESISVLIGMTGDIRGRLIIEGTNECMSKIGESMFGMPLEGEMLESFAAELGNMLAGNMATSLAADIAMDITPPTVIVGKTKLYGFSEAINLPVSLGGAGTIHLILMIEK